MNLPLTVNGIWTTFETIFGALSALGACHMTIIGGVVYKKSMIFGVFETVSIFLREIFIQFLW